MEKNILFCDVFEDHVDIDIEAPKSTNELLVSLHYHPYLRPYAPVNELWTQKGKKKFSFSIGFLLIENRERDRERERVGPDGSSCEGLLAMEIVEY